MKHDATIWRTPNLVCPACSERRVHQASERAAYHPLMGHGFNGTGWTHEILDPRAAENVRLKRAQDEAQAAVALQQAVGYGPRAQVTRRGN